MGAQRETAGALGTDGRSREEATSTARRQLRRVLVLLGVLDVSVLVIVVGLARAQEFLDLSTAEFLAAVLGGVGLILTIRLLMAIRLRRRSGELR
jgi:hypothetical protein